MCLRNKVKYSVCIALKNFVTILFMKLNTITKTKCKYLDVLKKIEFVKLFCVVNDSCHHNTEDSNYICQQDLISIESKTNKLVLEMMNG